MTLVARPAAHRAERRRTLHHGPVPPGRRPFRLVTTWRLPADVESTWAVLSDASFTWPRWWPQLTADVVDSTDDGTGSADVWSRVRVRVRSPLGFSLRFQLVLARSARPAGGRPGTSHLLASGDLEGTADVTVASDGPGRSTATLVWAVRLTRGGLIGALLSVLPRRLLVVAHAAVMRGGERGLQRYLNPSSPLPSTVTSS
jgi:hypothetical protein